MSHGDEYTSPPSFHFAFIDKLITAPNSKDRQRIDQVFYDHLSDLAAINEAICSIGYHRSFQPAGAKDFQKIVEQITKDSGGLVTNLVIHSTRDDARLWSKLEVFRSTPLPTGKVTPQSISQLNLAHQMLDDYWNEVRVVKQEEMKHDSLSEDALST